MNLNILLQYDTIHYYEDDKFSGHWQIMLLAKLEVTVLILMSQA
jgi:hypothetical protein